MTRSRVASALTTALFATALAAAIVSLFAVWRSYFGFHPAAGTMATIADALLRGEAPGRADGSVFLGSYYFVPYPLIVAAVHRLGLDWLESLRLASLFTALCLLIATGLAARALGAGRRGAWLAAALVMTTYPFKSTLIDGRADLLAAALSLAALAAWTRDENVRGWRTPALAAASILVKASSLTLPLAFTMWALWRGRGGALARFAPRFLVCVLGGVLILLPFHSATWYSDTLRALFTHAAGRSELVRGPAELIRYLGGFGELALFTVFGGVWLAGRRAREGRVQMFAFVSVLLTLGVMSNFASAQNHLVELAATLALCTALWAEPRLARRTLLPALALALAVLGASWRDLGGVLRHATEAANLRGTVIAAVRDNPGEVLTEDPLISLVAGRRAVVSDMDALRALALAGDPSAGKLIEALRQQRFGLIVLNDDVAAKQRWYAGVHFRDLTLDPMLAGYRDAGTADGYFLYRRLAVPTPLDRPAPRP